MCRSARLPRRYSTCTATSSDRWSSGGIMFRAHCPVLLMALILSSCDSPTSPTGSDPVLATISPTSTVAGSSDVTLSVTGIHFDDAAHHRSQVVWEANGNNTPLTTTFVSSTQLTAVIPA